MSDKSPRISGLSATVVLVFLACSVPLRADLVSALIGKTLENHQIGPSTVVPFYTFFFAGAYVNPADGYDEGTLTYPGPGSPQSLSPNVLAGPDNVGFQTGAIPNQATLDADYPFGIYTIQAENSMTMAMSSAVGITYTQDAYTSDTPELTAGSYNAFAAGINAS